MLKSLYEYYLQNIPHKGKRHIVKWSLKCLPFKTLKTHYGPIFKVQKHDKTNIYGLCGEYGNVVANHVRQLPKGDVFMDIGTNYGLFSLMASKTLGENGTVFSFEPNPFIYSSFIENIQLNNCRNIVPLQAAIAEKSGILHLNFDRAHSGKSHIADMQGTSTIKVCGFHPGQLNFLGEEIGTRNIHIKIDVEGYEARIIKILCECPWFSNIKSIVVEVSAANLATFESDVERDIYAPLTDKGFAARYGVDHSPHFDEIFEKS